MQGERADYEGVRTQGKSNRGWITRIQESYQEHPQILRLGRALPPHEVHQRRFAGTPKVRRDLAQDDKPVVELRFGESWDARSDCAD